MAVLSTSFAQLRIVAHQGGWDEALMVIGPLLVIAGLLWLANRRANEVAAEVASDAAEQRSTELPD